MSAYFLMYLLLGASAGLFAGLFGIGGGIILVPFLSWIFTDKGMPIHLIMLCAIATSLATIIPTSISSVMAHNKLGAIKWDIVMRLAPAIMLGSMAGTLIAQQLDSGNLKTIFGLFLIAVSIQTGLQLKPKTQTLKLGRWVCRFGGAAIGTCSSLLGIGGGTLTVPFLLKSGQPIRNAVAISSACGFPIAVAGTISYIILGLNTPDRLVWSMGYINGPAFIGIVASSIFFAPLGAKLAHRLPTDRLKQLFAIFIFVVACKLLWR